MKSKTTKNLIQGSRCCCRTRTWQLSTTNQAPYRYSQLSPRTSRENTKFRPLQNPPYICGLETNLFEAKGWLHKPGQKYRSDTGKKPVNKSSNHEPSAPLPRLALNLTQWWLLRKWDKAAEAWGSTVPLLYFLRSIMPLTSLPRHLREYFIATRVVSDH